MHSAHRNALLGFALALASAGCSTAVGVDSGPPDACANDPLCIPCTFDTDCPNDGVCGEGICTDALAPGQGPGGDAGCAQTSECPLDQMCNGSTVTCDALPAGWCRRDVDCSGGASVCSAASDNVPGLCVECLVDSDCIVGERCGAGGTCAGDPTSCPANSTLTGGTCRCNAGFHLDSVSHLCELNAPTAGCVQNAHPIPGQGGGCECDLGYEPSPNGNACVRPPNGGGVPPPNGGGNPPPNNGGNPPPNNGGGNGGGIIGNCGPNTIAVFFVCFCLPGFAPNPNGDIGCSESDDDDDDVPPDNGGGLPPDSGGVPQPSTDVCAANGWYNDDVCDQFCLNPDPDCDDPDSTSPGGDTDICADNGWYGDDICDTFCVAPDPDCGTTGTGSDDVCEENGWYGDDICDTNCAFPDPDCAGDGDVCAENGWYGDDVCDTLCAFPDPDCGGAIDICEDNGWYSDTICDTDCASPDPDCSDVCVENDWYGDGVCDSFCDLQDPDC